jgi:methionine aminopeptidase
MEAKDKKSKKKEEEESEGSEEEEKEETFETSPILLNKYQSAARLSNEALKYVISLCVPGADIAEICSKGDKKIEEDVGKEYSSKKCKVKEKGIAFPTCLSVNEVCGHFSPLKDESKKLADGDLVKMYCSLNEIY